jgi:hypothetical protein
MRIAPTLDGVTRIMFMPLFHKVTAADLRVELASTRGEKTDGATLWWTWLASTLRASGGLRVVPRAGVEWEVCNIIAFYPFSFLLRYSGTFSPL